MKMLRVATLSLLIFSCWSNAGLIGSTVVVDYLYPDGSTVVESSGAVAVGAGPEYTFFAGFPEMQIDIDDGSVRATEVATGSFTFQSATFNGVRLTFSGAPTILNVTLDPSSTTTYASLGYTDNQILLDMANITWMQGDFALLDVQLAPESLNPQTVPSPAAGWAGMALLGGLAMVRFVRRRKL